MRVRAKPIDIDDEIETTNNGPCRPENHCPQRFGLSLMIQVGAIIVAIVAAHFTAILVNRDYTDTKIEKLQTATETKIDKVQVTVDEIKSSVVKLETILERSNRK
jgi:hypothetical protein